MARTASTSRNTSRGTPWGVLVALAVGVLACRAGESERCVCAEDCKDTLVCVASGRVLQSGECTPAVGEDANPGVCVPIEEAADGDGGDGYPEVFMDLGSKRDFDPGPPPDPETESGTTEATSGSGTTDATGSSGTTDAGSSSSESSSSGSGSSSSGGSSSGSSGTTAGN